MAASAGVAQGDILHNALPSFAADFPPMYHGTFGHPFDTVRYNGIGASNVFGFSVDSQAADDFSISDAYFIDRVTIDMFRQQVSAPPQSVMVEFFSDAGGRPADTAHQAVTVGAANLTYQFFETFGQFGGGNSQGIRLGVDLTGLGIELDAGTWWVSAVPIGDDAQFGALRVLDQATGSPMHFRHGGEAHGSGYPGGVEWGSTEWMTYGGPDGARPGHDLLGDLAIRVEGTLVPAPGGVAFLGLIGLAAARRRRR